jgi:hypothetical protein
MSIQIDKALVQSYHSNIEIQFQQMGSRLRVAVRTETQQSEYDYYDRIGATEATKITARHSDTPMMETPHDRRRVAMDDYDWADLIDNQDKLRMLSDPTSAYVQNAVMALGRAIDRTVLAAAVGTAYTGKTGATATTFASGSEVAVDYVETGSVVNSNLTIAKLRRARYLFDKNEAANDGDPLYMIVTANQVQSLLRTTEVTSGDYNTVKALVQGEINSFMGFNFIRTELLPFSAANIRDCLAWSRSGMLLAMGKDITTEVDRLPTKRYSVQVYASASFGSVRMWEEKVLRIKCDETK